MKAAWPVIMLVLAAGCSTTTPSALRKAAEPAKSPALTAPPAGTVIPVGPDAEGLAVDARTHVAAVGVRQPFGITLVDTRTGRVLRTVPTDGHVRHLATRGSTLLVPLEDAGAVLELTLPSGALQSRAISDGYPHGVAAVGTDGALVGNEKGGRVSLVRSGSVVATADGFPQPGGSAAAGDRVFVVDVGDQTLTWLDALTLRRGRSVPAGNGPTHPVTDKRGNVVVVDTRGDAVTVYSRDLEELRKVSLPGSPYGIAYDEVRDQLWITLTGRNEVVCLSASDLTEVRRLPTVRQPNTVGVDSSTGTVVVASRTEGLLQLLR